MKKIALTLVAVSALGLAACQSNSAANNTATNEADAANAAASDLENAANQVESAAANVADAAANVADQAGAMRRQRGRRGGQRRQVSVRAYFGTGPRAAEGARPFFFARGSGKRRAMKTRLALAGLAALLALAGCGRQSGAGGLSADEERQLDNAAAMLDDNTSSTPRPTAWSPTRPRSPPRRMRPDAANASAATPNTENGPETSRRRLLVRWSVRGRRSASRL